MKRVLASSVILLTTTAAQAQTSYPMLMSIQPVAAQAGQASEHEVTARYSMFGAYRVLVSGDGVTGEVVTPMEEKDGKKPDMPKITVRFTVAPDAEPGVRDVRIATPQGVSTLGQLVVVADPVVTEAKKNDTPADAQQVPLPAALCGTIEKAEDVDFYRFQVEAGAALSFHVRGMRLEDKIHDLQTHADPSIALRNAAGTTLATSDNVYAADPYLSYRFEHAGEYLLEIRDVRYQGNAFWTYCVEVNARPFVAHVHPMGLLRGQANTVRLVGDQLPADPQASVTVGDDRPLGPQSVRLPLGDGLSNPVPVVVTDLPHTIESDAENNTPADAQSIPVPAAVSGRVEAPSDIDCYRFEAKKGDQVSVEVIARRQDSPLDPIVRILNGDGKPLVENDDLRVHKWTYQDAAVETWTAPADGSYAIELRDLHLRGGDQYVYFLKVTRPEPSFELYADSDKTQLSPGTCGTLFVRAERKHGFAGEIQLHIDGLPEGVTATCGRILAGKGQDGCIVLQAAPEAKLAVGHVTIRGTARHKVGDGPETELAAVALPGQEIYMPGGGRSHWPVDQHAVAVNAPGDLRSVHLSTYELTLQPGQSQKIEVTIERAPGFDKNVTLDLVYQHLNSVFANPLPEGVTIDAKNSKTLLTGKETKGHITLVAAKDAPPLEKQQVAVMAHIAINFVMKSTFTSRPVIITVAKP